MLQRTASPLCVWLSECKFCREPGGVRSPRTLTRSDNGEYQPRLFDTERIISANLSGAERNGEWSPSRVNT